MRLALHASNHFGQVLLALAFISLFALVFSDCPALGRSEKPVPVSGYQVDIPDLIEVRDGIYSGGQPTPKGIRRLTELGIKTLVNLRPYEENGARDEWLEAAELKMEYVHIPVTPTSFTYEKVAALHEFISDKNSYPIFIHCRTGNRAAGTWFLYRVIFEKAEISEALSEAKALGMEPQLERILLQFLKANHFP